MTAAWAMVLLLGQQEPVSQERPGSPGATTVAPAPQPSGPDEPDFDDPIALERAAREAFSDQRYGDTARFAARAHELTGDIRHLYAQAHAERFRGNCTVALGLYARVMAAQPDNELGELARQGIKLCEQAENEDQPGAPAGSTEDSRVGPPPPAKPGETADPPASPDPEPPTERQADLWIRDPLGGGLLGAGVASVAVGAGLWLQASADLRASGRAGDEASFADARARAKGLRIGSAVAFSVGGALVVGAAVRYWLVARRNRPGSISLAPAPGRGVVVGWTRSF